MGQGGAVRLADRGVAPGQGHVAQVQQSLEPVVAGKEDLAAPDGAVGAVAGAVEGEADDAIVLGHAVLHHDGREMGMVMLDQRDVASVLLFGPPSGLVAGVGVGDDGRWVDAVHVVELAHRPLEGGQRLEAAHVADVLADPGRTTRGQAERVLQLTPHGEHRRHLEGQADGEGGIAPGTPDGEDVTVTHPHHRVVARHVDGPVVEQPGVRDVPEARPGVRILVADGLVGEVPARHDEHGQARGVVPRHLVEQEMMQRGVGEQEPDGRMAGRHLLGQRSARTSGQEHDGALRAAQELFFLRVDPCQRARHLHVAHHDGQRLGRPSLASPQRGECSAR